MRSEEKRGGGGYLAGARAVLPLALATGVMGISFGLLTYSLGWGMLAPIVFSVIAFSGTAQFAVASVLGAGGGVMPAIVAAVLLNARFLPMGIAVAPFLKGGPFRRALEGQAIVDASWAMASRGGGRFDREFMIGATIPQATLWIGGTVVGVLAGGLLGGDVELLGLDAIFPAFYLSLLVEEVRGGGQTIAVVLLAAALALLLVPLAPPGIPVIASCTAALLGLRGRSS